MSGEVQEVAFCLKEIGESKSCILSLSSQLPKLREEYFKYKGTGLKREYDSLVDLHKAVTRLLEEFPALIQQLNEYGDSELVGTTEKLYKVLKKYDYLGPNDYSRLCGALDNFASSLPATDHNINMGKLAHLANRARMGYFPTDLTHVEKIKNAMVFPEEPINLIDPCCGEGLALETFSKGTSAVTYGIELDEVRGEEAQSRLYRVGFGSYFFSRISLNAFSGLWLNPPYLSVPGENGNKRLEKAFLADCVRLLQIGGIMVYIIPHYRATPDVCRVLCENFTDLRVHKFEGKEFDKFKQVVFIGKRIERREANKQTKRLSEFMLNVDNVPSINELPADVYALPVSARKVELFKGAVFNVNELADQLKKSKSTERLFEDRTLDTRKRQPLLPFNLSQIGLVGASGMMNGLVACKIPHVIKGRIVKEKKTKIGEEDKYGNTEVKEITSNKLIFNVLTPKGLKQLG